MSDALLQAIISGNPLDLPGLGSNDSGLTILFPLSLGNTVNDLANALNLPVDSILAVNPGLRADSPLSVSQVVGLPDDHVGRIMQSMNVAGSHASIPAASPLTPSPHVVPPSSGSPESYAIHASSDNVTVIPPTLRATAAALDLFNHPQQDMLFPPPVDEGLGRWSMSVDPGASTAYASEPLASMTVTWVSEPASMPTPNQVPALVSTPMPAPETTTVLAMPAPVIDPGKVVAASSSQRQDEREGAFSFTQTINVVVPAGQDRQHKPVSNPPPPLPMDDRRFAGPVIQTLPPSSGISIFAPTTTMNVMDLTADSRPLTLQLMALLLAQSGGAIAAGTAAPAPSPASPFIDPQAFATLAANLRTTKVIDVGAGRSMQFSLVNDRLRRIDAIGQEQRTPARRTGNGLEEVRISRPEDETLEQTEEQREQGRRRRAAIAAMRRRRRPRSRRCRCWHGVRHDLRPSRAMRYPKGVDFAEFRRRLPPRYMWNVGGGER